MDYLSCCISSVNSYLLCEQGSFKATPKSENTLICRGVVQWGPKPPPEKAPGRPGPYGVNFRKQTSTNQTPKKKARPETSLDIVIGCG